MNPVITRHTDKSRGQLIELPHGFSDFFDCFVGFDILIRARTVPTPHNLSSFPQLPQNVVPGDDPEKVHLAIHHRDTPEFRLHHQLQHPCEGSIRGYGQHPLVHHKAHLVLKEPVVMGNHRLRSENEVFEYIEFRDNDISESKDLDENTVLDVDNKGNVCAITFEHASQRTDVSHLIVEGIAA